MTPDAGRVELRGKKLEDWLMGFLVCERGQIVEKVTTHAETIRQLREERVAALDAVTVAHETIRRLEGLMAPLPCGHPTACRDLTDRQNTCLWCLDKQRAEAAEGLLRDTRVVLENLLNYVEYPCECSKTGDCDKGYRNDMGRAIRAAETLFAKLTHATGEGA